MITKITREVEKGLGGSYVLTGKEYMWFYCPGCKEAHSLIVKGKGAWQWNGDRDRPSIKPSILVTGKSRCHSFVTDGQIKFLGDCTHKLSGQNVSIPKLPDWLAK